MSSVNKAASFKMSEQDKPRIVYHHRIASKDGQQVHVEEIIRAFKNLGAHVVLAAPSTANTTEFGHDGGLVSRLKSKLPSALYELMELGYSLVVAARLYKTIKSHKPDFIYERYNLYQPAGVFLARLMKIPIILEVNAPLVEERSKYHHGLSLKKLASWVESWTWRHADAVLPVSQVLADKIKEAGVDPSRIHVIHNGVRESDFQKKRDEQKSDDTSTLVVGFVGFMHLTSGLDQALHALSKAKNKNVRLVCVGDGPNVDKINQMARTLGVEDRVETTGLLGRGEVFEKMMSFDIAILPDVTSYASPLKLFEYMLCKHVIVAPDSDNIKEILTPQSAVLFSHKTGDFTSALMRTIDSFESVSHLGNNAFERIGTGRFTWDQNAITICKLAESLLMEKKI